MAVKEFKVGDRVRFKSTFLSGSGVISYIDTRNLFNGHLSPIQVDVDGTQYGLLRFSLKELTHYEE